MTFLEVLQKNCNQEANCFVRDFDNRYKNSERNGAYARMLCESDCSSIISEDIFAADWEVYDAKTMEFRG